MDRREFLRLCFDATATAAACGWLLGAQRAAYGFGDEGVEFGRTADPVGRTASRGGDVERVYAGLPSGLLALDQAIGGMRPGQLIVIGGRPGMGKTSLAMRIAEHVGITERTGVLFFSLELGAQDLAQSMLCARARLGPWNLRRGLVSTDDWQRLLLASVAFHEAPILIEPSSMEFTGALRAAVRDAVEREDVPLRADSPAPVTIGELRTRAVRTSAELRAKGQELGLVVVDFLQFVEVEGAGTREGKISTVARSLRSLAQELSCPVIALSQVSRAVERREDHRPRLADLGGRGAIAEAADVVLMLYRDEVYNERTRAPGICDVIVAKGPRGSTGTVRLAFLRECMRFEELGGEPERAL